MANSSYLVALFCASAGKNGEELGADEEQIILFVYLLFDVPNNKVKFICYLSVLLVSSAILLFILLILYRISKSKYLCTYEKAYLATIMSG